MKRVLPRFLISFSNVKSTLYPRIAQILLSSSDRTPLFPYIPLAGWQIEKSVFRSEAQGIRAGNGQSVRWHYLSTGSTTELMPSAREKTQPLRRVIDLLTKWATLNLTPAAGRLRRTSRNKRVERSHVKAPLHVSRVNRAAGWGEVVRYRPVAKIALPRLEIEQPRRAVVVTPIGLYLTRETPPIGDNNLPRALSKQSTRVTRRLRPTRPSARCNPKPRSRDRVTDTSYTGRHYRPRPY